MKKQFEKTVKYQHCVFVVDGYFFNERVRIDHVYIENTNIEIMNSLTMNQYDELCELILELCTAQ